MLVNIRIESDVFGEIQVLVDKYWGVQIECFFENFKINQFQDCMFLFIVKVFGIFKGVVVMVNMCYGFGMYFFFVFL